MSELIRQGILSLASTVHLWRDLAVVILAAFVIGCLYVYAES